MDNHGSRLMRLEDEIKADEQQIAQLFRRVAALEQQQRAGDGSRGSGGGGGAVYFGCTLTGPLAHGSSISGQAIWKMPGRVAVTAAGTIYNDGPTAANDIATGKQVICLANDDGSYTAGGVYC